jgi:hypothetical protein
MNFNDLLAREGIEPSSVMVLRHRPTEPPLRKVLPWLAVEQPRVYNAYQQSQGLRVEKAMTRATFVASFIGHDAGKALWVGMYKNCGAKSLSYDGFWSVKENRVLNEFGMRGLTRERASLLWFDLQLTDFYSTWMGKLVVNWPGRELSWWRWAERNEFSILAIHEDSLLDKSMPDWCDLCLGWSELGALPAKWRTTLSQWRGIYFILDTSDGKGYVGSAYGKDNILGRWRNYAAAGHGGNKLLRKRKPEDFQFSILQRVSPDMEADDVIALESSWKNRLHTRECGLNEN